MSSFLPPGIYSAEQLRALDRFAIERANIPGYTLMQRAGRAAFSLLVQRWPSARRILVACGPGNNGGDGYVLARLARERQLEVTLISTCDPAQLRGDAARAHQDFVAAGGSVAIWEGQPIGAVDVIVDAIFGIGLSRPADARIAPLIDAINAHEAPVLALDVPSGLHTDTGEALGSAVRAAHTITFIGLKLGFYLGTGPDLTGRVQLDDLSVPREAWDHVPASARRIDEHELASALPPRPRTAHKGQHGHILVVGGNRGMPGAARLAGEAALRSGAGRVTIATHPENVAAIVGTRPELMCSGIQSEQDLQPLLARVDVLAVGPGLGQDEWAQRLLNACLAARLPSVLDADALNLLARNPPDEKLERRWIMTPHPAEAARLLGNTTAQVQADRLGAARALAQKYRSVIVLKGAGSIVMAQERLPAICDRGNPGMASPGMGDVLTGIVAAMLGQLSDPARAAGAGVLVHAMAGDLAAKQRGERGLIASDLFEHVPTCVNPIASC